MPLTFSERRTLHAIHDGDTGPHSVAVLRSLVWKGLLTDRQKLTTEGMRLMVEEAARRRDAEIRSMRESIRENRARRERWFGS
ncbi:hypothetical protein [Pseudonocardia endophytica]|uniref:hypothetical protein n=1 Tax=Pseudonocardia endophytica TaxID=401976 RepID=UPI0010504265|nr:hypothetical protein [Pseudonocardia endophytica]